MRTLVALLLVTFFAASASAQTDAEKKSGNPKNREEFMQRVLLTALDNLGSQRCAKGDRCAPATDAEKKNPPLSLSETSQVVGRGIFSGGAFHCGMDWEKRNYQPMMAYWRDEKKKNDRQLALIATIHGMIFEKFVADFGPKGKCPDEMKNDLEKRLDFKP
jgi:hypothetical protein